MITATGDMTGDGLRVTGATPLPTAGDVRRQAPCRPAATDDINRWRSTARDIVAGMDPRLLVVVGPCSIHDVDAARDYAVWLREEAASLGDALFVVMRTYFEKPRTRVGWQGFLDDPMLDGSGHIGHGLVAARQLLCEIAELGVPTATEFVDVLTPPHLVDLVTWAAVGARTTESPVHRQLASGLPCPVGFKNNTSGDVQVAVNALVSAATPQRLITAGPDGRLTVLATAGNPDCHVILRGGEAGPNYDATSIADAGNDLRAAGRPPRVMIDCGHGNCRGDYRRQRDVGLSVAEHLVDGRDAVLGVMFESALVEGRQALRTRDALVYGQSITDGCLGLADTAHLLHELAAAVRASRALPRSAAALRA